MHTGVWRWKRKRSRTTTAAPASAASTSPRANSRLTRRFVSASSWSTGLAGSSADSTSRTTGSGS
jgi:hypothetical protein